MEAQQATTDELVSEYTTARHKFDICGGEDGGMDHATAAWKEGRAIEQELESRGVSVDKLRQFWDTFATKHGLDY